jgi:hypothetical protein
MKTKEEIEKLAEKLYFHVDGFKEEIAEGKKHYISGYTQCQEDIRELLLEIKTNWKGNKLIGGTYEKICNSLNKQD